jgi:hypothetical protein
MLSHNITAAAAGTWTLADYTVSRMDFGSMRITSNPDRELAISVLRRTVELGVNHIDTAAFYLSPGGTLNVGTGPIRYATELIRQALAPYPDDLVIATKVGPGYDPSTGCRSLRSPAPSARPAPPMTTPRPSAPSPPPTTPPRTRFGCPGPCIRGRTFWPSPAPATLTTLCRTLPPAR